MVTTVLSRVVIVREVVVSKKMDHVIFVCLVTMVMHAIYNVHTVLMEHVIKQTVTAPLDVKQVSSWTDVMQLVLSTVPTHVASKVGHVLVDVRMDILETIVKLFVQCIVPLTVTKKMENVPMDAMENILEKPVKTSALKIVQKINVVKLMVNARWDVGMGGWEIDVQKVRMPSLFVLMDIN